MAKDLCHLIPNIETFSHSISNILSKSDERTQKSLRDIGKLQSILSAEIFRRYFIICYFWKSKHLVCRNKSSKGLEITLEENNLISIIEYQKVLLALHFQLVTNVCAGLS